ncbi:hypothetical protein VNI00_007626 [Paramarasmius palmivorus]|uniref:Uncharacterized protein n=1 Tax=Paramarasmius palmivorus TaxID=297713 RepID=A0AAW0D2C3_9AGAR
MIISRFNPLLLSFAILTVNAGLQWFDDLEIGGQVKVQSSSGYNWDALIPDSESKPLPSFLPGHPKKRGGEIGCIQIPSLAGIHGPCSSTENLLPSRQAGLIAVSMDGALLAVCERHGSEIFIYNTNTLKIQHRLNSRHGMGSVRGMLFGAGSRLVVSSYVGGMPGKSVIRVFDLDRQSNHGVEAMKNRTLDAYKAVLQESQHMPHAIASERLEEMVSTLIWETRLQGDIDEGWAYEGFLHSFRSASDCSRPLSIDGRYLISSYGGISTSVVDIAPDDSRPPQRLLTLPLDSQTYGRDIAVHFTNTSSQGQPLIATISPGEDEGDEHRHLRIWNAVTGNIEHVFPVPKGVDWNSVSFTRCGVSFSPDGKMGVMSLSSFETNYQLWHVENGTASWSIKADGLSLHRDGPIAFSTDGELVFSTNGGLFCNNAHIAVYNTSTGDLIHDWVLRDLVDRATDYMLDSKVVARDSTIQKTHYAQNGMVICTLNDGSIALFDPKTNREGWIPPSKVEEKEKSNSNTKTRGNQSQLITYAISDTEVAMSPDGNTLYLADVDGNVRIWSL